MIEIQISQKGARAESIKQLIEAAIHSKYPAASVFVSRKEPSESRPERFSDAQSDVENAKSEAENLRDELQEWRDNMPENMQSGQKADELDSAISSLEEFINACETASGAEVEFPGMM